MATGHFSGTSAELADMARQALTLYERALELRQDGIAEALLSVLEELCKAEPTCEAMLNQAYLCIGARRSTRQ